MTPEQAAALRDLVVLIEPPPDPLPVGDIDALATELGITFPDDYRALLQVYGRGSFCNDLRIWAANTDLGSDHKNHYLADLQEFHFEALANALELGVTVGGVVNDGSAFPSDFERVDIVEELTCWGLADGEAGFWHRVGDDPNQWPVVVTDFWGFDYHRGGLVAYLLDLYSDRFVGRRLMHAENLPFPPYFSAG